MRPSVIEYFPSAPGLPVDKSNFLKQVDDLYVTDAYNSLSIEGYRVTTELIERVRAVLGHFIFVYIHPYMDGNGRISRFLMNAMLASGGYKWTIIPVGQRNEYLLALEQASVDQDISGFAKFLAKLVKK